MRERLTRLLLPAQGDGRYAPVADGFRALAVLVVAWFHIWQQSWLSPVLTLGSVRLDFSAPVRTGYMMVDVLLLLSGFLLFLPYARARADGAHLPELRTYYVKRALRILPSYWLSVLFYLFVYALPNREYGSLRHFLLDIAGHLTFTHNLTYEAYLGSRLNPVLWTLAVEVQFYLVAPLIGRAFVKKPFLTYAGMLATAFMYRFVYVAGMQDTSLYFNRLPAMLDVYANGMMFAWLFVALQKRMKPRWWTALPAAAVCAAALAGIWLLMDMQSHRSGVENIRMGQMVYRYPLTLLAGLFLAAGGQAPRWFQWLWNNRLMRFIAGISYNLYIWHFWVMLRLRAWRIPPYTDDMPQRTGEMPWQLHYTLLCFAGAVALGTLLTYAWERPMNRLGARLLQRGRHERKKAE